MPIIFILLIIFKIVPIIGISILVLCLIFHPFLMHIFMDSKIISPLSKKKQEKQNIKKDY
jgi:hypothetical protein